MKKTTHILLLLLITIGSSFAQEHKNKKLDDTKPATLWGIGAYYDFQNGGFAIDVRAKIPVYDKICISPRISFYPPFNNINEIYGGADVDYNFMKYKFLSPYVYIGGYYDNWINSSDFQNPKAKRNSVMPEGGVGVVFDVKCLHPYVEYRYDPHWEEGSIGIGLLFNFKCMFNSESRKVKSCPHF